MLSKLDLVMLGNKCKEAILYITYIYIHSFLEGPPISPVSSPHNATPHAM